MIRRASTFIAAVVVLSSLAIASAEAYSTGDLDTSFGGGAGYVTQNFSPNFEMATDVAIQPDGKIVTVGTTDIANQYDAVVLRYNPDGTLDTSFSADGMATFDIAGDTDSLRSVAIQPDGKILSTGSMFNAGRIDLILVRHKSDGSLDESFDGDAGNGNGIVISSNQGTLYGSSVAMLPDGRIVVGGSSAPSNVSDFYLSVFNSDGTLDFATSTDIGGSDDSATAMTIQPDGKILLAGYSQTGNHSDTAVARFNPDGTLDTSFSGDGIFTIDAAGNQNDEARAMTLQPDGKILLAGSVTSGMDLDIAVLRINPDGTLDTSFGTGGKVVWDYAGLNDQAFSMETTADGTILVAGSAESAALNEDFVIIRLTSEGTLDLTFSGDGVISLDLAGGQDFANSIALDGSSRAVVVGTVRRGFNVADYDIVTARFHLRDEPAPVVNPLADLVGAPASTSYKALNKKVVLRWSAVAGASSYRVVSSAGVEKCATTTTSCTIPRLRNGKAYIYRVYALNSDGAPSVTGTRIVARPGFQVKKTSLKVRRSSTLTSIVTTPSKGTKTWRVTSGKCRIQGSRLVAPAKKGTCKLRLATAKRGSYAAMSTTITVTITR